MSESLGQPEFTNRLQTALQAEVPKIDEDTARSLEQAERRKLDRDREKFDLDGQRQIHWVRIAGIAALFLLVCGWLAVICVFLYHAGLSWIRMSDSVQIALITTTTVNVIGLFYLAAKWLYPKS